jgi:hypothetical protein
MSEPDDHGLERRLHEVRAHARDEFVQTLASEVRGRRDGSARSRPRLTLALALSLALIVSVIAFGGVGAASSALHSSSSAVRSAVGSEKPKGKSYRSYHGGAAKYQYHPKVVVCYPRTHSLVTYTTVTKYKWVWKTVVRDGKKVRALVKVPYARKVRVKSKTTAYESKTVSERRVPELVSKGAVYPVPAGGCSSLDGSTRDSD